MVRYLDPDIPISGFIVVETFGAQGSSVPIPVPESFGTGIGTETDFGGSAEDRYHGKSTDNRYSSDLEL